MGLKVICFGELLWDLLPGGPQLGGAPLNFAYRLRALGDRPRLVSRVGGDALGRRALEQVAALGLVTRYIGQAPPGAEPTGTVPVRFEEGQPRYEIVPNVAYDAIAAPPTLLARAARFDAVYHGTLAQRDPRSRAALASVLAAAPRALRFVDLNLRPNCYTAEIVRGALTGATIAKMNREETEAAADAAGIAPSDDAGVLALRLARRYGLRVCIVTDGERGAVAADGASGQVWQVGAHAVAVDDTIGAGDAFAAGFLHCFQGGASMAESLRGGSALGGLAAARAGGTSLIDVAEWAAAARGLEARRLSPRE